VHNPAGKVLMDDSTLRLVKRIVEFHPKEEVDLIPPRRRGLYVLYNYEEKNGKGHYEVVYVGSSTKMCGRLKNQRQSERKSSLWTHFSAYEAWDNVTDNDIRELEGLFRHIYRKDSQANKLNIQRAFDKLAKVRRPLSDWK
jgi:hypothetical protein